jgi:hypothetical protein
MDTVVVDKEVEQLPSHQHPQKQQKPKCSSRVSSSLLRPPRFASLAMVHTLAFFHPQRQVARRNTTVRFIN